ncbi:hypothetical protein M514_12644 [Trichuris suis]|uniref:Uncharacterized protein n=1 Tax=Trichuris suis TaxID=68888 RepID=A0A085N3R3_9BILA|nr:hypothetical protein M513_12644 [Trichuris suis]KFD64109.1 hypothetical protein M514_12644 [Trichuris suis]
MLAKHNVALAPQNPNEFFIATLLEVNELVGNGVAFSECEKFIFIGTSTFFKLRFGGTTP